MTWPALATPAATSAICSGVASTFSWPMAAAGHGERVHRRRRVEQTRQAW